MKSSIFIIVVLLAILTACKKENNETEPQTEINADSLLYREAVSDGYVYYKNGATLTGTSPSPHGLFRLRFNGVAFAALDSTGELPVGTPFPNGSVVVKELMSGNEVSLYVVMKKDASNKNSANSWVWAEYNPNGAKVYSVELKGAGCITCHSSAPHRDLIKTFDLH